MECFLGAPRFNSNNPLDILMHVAVDNDSRIIISDRNKGEVLLLRMSPQNVRELISKPNFYTQYYPARICLDEANGRLHIAGWRSEKNSAKVFVFKLARTGNGYFEYYVDILTDHFGQRY